MLVQFNKILRNKYRLLSSNRDFGYVYSASFLMQFIHCRLHRLPLKTPVSISHNAPTRGNVTKEKKRNEMK